MKMFKRISVVAFALCLMVGGAIASYAVQSGSTGSVELGLLHLTANNDERGYALPASGHSAPTPTPTPPPPSASLSATGCAINVGADTCAASMSWSSSNATAPSVRQNGGQISVAPAGSANPSIGYGNTTFSFFNGGSQLASQSVTASCTAGSYWYNGRCGLPVTVDVSLDAPATAYVGQEVTLNWTTSNADNCVASGGQPNGGWYSSSANSGTTIIGATSENFVLTCAGPNGPRSDSATLTSTLPSVSIAVDRTLVRSGDTVTVDWTIDTWTAVDPNATCQIAGLEDGFYNVESATGARPSTPLTNARRIRIDCTIFGNTYSDSAAVEVIPTVSEI